jgi:hypothetical protein
MSFCLRQIVKDCRLLKPLIAAWFVINVANTVFFSRSIDLSRAWMYWHSTDSETGLARLAAADIAAAPGHFGAGVGFVSLILLHWIGGALLVARAVALDPPISTVAAWPTRPISRAEMLVSKLLFTLTVVVVPPLLSGILVLLANGATFGDTVRLVPWTATSSFAFFAAVAVAATLGESITGTAVWVIVLWSILAVLPAAVAGWWPGAWRAACWGSTVTMASAVTCQYQYRRRWSAILVGAVTFAVTVAVLGRAPTQGAPSPSEPAVASGLTIVPREPNASVALPSRHATEWLVGSFQALGLPPGYEAIPAGTSAVLTRASLPPTSWPRLQRAVTDVGGAGTTQFGPGLSRWNWTLPGLGSLVVLNPDPRWFRRGGQEIPYLLFAPQARIADLSGHLEATVALDIVQWRVTARVPARKDASYHAGSVCGVVGGLDAHRGAPGETTSDRMMIDVWLSESGLKPDALVRFALHIPAGPAVLLLEDRGDTCWDSPDLPLVSQLDRCQRHLSAPWPADMDVWSLRAAELLRIERVGVGQTTKTIVVDDLVAQPPHETR